MTATHRQALYDEYVSGHIVDGDEVRGFEDIAALFGRHLPADRRIRILDVGCGDGRTVRFLQSHGYSNVAGIDVSPQQVERAHALGSTEVELADLFLHAEQSRDSYDLIVAIDVVEHFERADAVRVFSTLFSMLQPGGRLLIRTPNGASPFSGRLLYSDLTHGVIYTSRSICQVAAAARFSGAHTYPARPSGRTVPRQLRRGLWRCIEALIKIPLILETGELTGHVVTQNLVAVLDK